MVFEGVSERKSHLHRDPPGILDLVRVRPDRVDVIQ
jgi:hypothetical protein